jgi:thiamine pyrophosphokinase
MRFKLSCNVDALYIKRTLIYFLGILDYALGNGREECCLMRSNLKALSTIIWLILILCSIIFGALLSYIWVLGNYYAEPQNTINLIVTNASFQVNRADRFNITVLNTSNSIASANVTQIYVTPEGFSGIANVTDTSPEKLPIVIDRGATKTIECSANWGQFSGAKVIVNLVTPNATVQSPAIQTKIAALTVQSFFDPAISVRYFNASITNSASSAINLTISNIFLDTTEINNTSPKLPQVLAPTASVLVQCFANWTGNSKPKVTVETQEGYSAQSTQNVSASVSLQITNVKFNLTNPNADDLNVTLSNSADSGTKVDLTNLVLTTNNNTQYTRLLNVTLTRNETLTKNIKWPWKNYRNESLSLIANTTQGFVSNRYVVTTPQTIVFDFSTAFNLTSPGNFTVNVTNEPCSLHTINVTEIKFNQNVTTIKPTTISSGTTSLFDVIWNWLSFRNRAATITVFANNTNTYNKTITLPTVDLRISAVFNSSLGMPYSNVTITNTAYSDRSVTISQITFTANGTVFNVDGTLTSPPLSPNGYSLSINSYKTFVCPWNWQRYHGQITITIQSKEGFTATKTLTIP